MKHTKKIGSTGAFGKVREIIAKKKAEREAAQSAGQAPDVAEAAGEEMAAADAGGEGAVPPHGPEAHTGGAGPQGGGTALDKFKQKNKTLLGKMGSRGIGDLYSDIRLKENITITAISKSGIPAYEFNYIGCSHRYSGAMAQDLLSINPDAVSLDSSVYYKVNYNNIDVDMHLIN